MAGLVHALAFAPEAGAAQGVATWYDDGPGIYAAAGPALRRSIGPGWRGTEIAVCAGGECVTVTLSDFCQCHRGELDERLVDLSPSAFSRLANLRRGKVEVDVSW